jgi:hypothetical protein
MAIVVESLRLAGELARRGGWELHEKTANEFAG